MRHMLCHLLLTAALFTLPLAPPAFADSPATSPAIHNAAYWSALENRLGDEDPKVRDAGQNELSTITYHERATLQNLLDRATDDEVKSRLAVRIAEIDEQLAVDPPPMSIAFKDATLADVAQALHQATGIPISTWPGENTGGDTFTLTATDQPFWKIFTDLSAQHSLNVQHNNGFQIMRQESGLSHCFPATAGFVIFPNAINRFRTADLQSNAMGAESLHCSYTLAADPRIKILRFSQPALTEVVDNAGNTLLAADPAANPDNFMQNFQSQCFFQNSVSLQIPAAIGTRIASAKGQAHMLIQIAATHIDIAAPQDTLNQPISLGPQTLTIQKFHPQDQTIDFSFTVASPAPRGPRAGVAGETDLPIHLDILDGRDHVVWATDFTGGTGGNVGTGDSKPPFKLRLSAPTKTKNLLVEFEMKDLPLPPLH